MITLADLIAGLTERTPPDTLPGRTIQDVIIDSRQASPGSLFIAFPGERHDGHDFVADAVARGVAVILAERLPVERAQLLWESGEVQIFQVEQVVYVVVDSTLGGLQRAATHWRRKHTPTVTGITGSVGKTTTKEAITTVLKQRYRVLSSRQNYNNEIGLPLTLLHLTPSHEQVVLEMGMYDVGEIGELARIAQPRIGVVTNVGPTHLERLGTMERIAQAKAELPQALPAADEGGIAILNLDDKWVHTMAQQTQACVFTYGLRSDADLWADKIESQGLEGIRFRFHFAGETIHANLPLLGRHSVHTALRAAAVGLVNDLSWEEILAGLQDQPAQLRLFTVPGPKGSLILDDTYNASPASCIAALTLLHELDGRKIAVLGDMYELGHYEDEGHKVVGRRARQVLDVLITVGPLGSIIGREAMRVGMPADRVHLLEAKREVIPVLRSIIEPSPIGDRILIKGSRSMEMEEIVEALTQTPVAGDRSLEEEPS
jgi:UDP-N-acetylmuramoyl-tripeptide--D-alanyl-D-alanine ligase